MSIFKYFTEEAHARAFIDNGLMLFRPLSFFRMYEDGQIRGDARDGTLRYAPASGLQITKQDGTALTLKDWRFTSSAKNDDILVYCASNQRSTQLAERFQSPFCVEITDTDPVLARLKARAHPTSQLDYEQLLSGCVDYRRLDRKPRADWALPDKVAFIKSDAFEWQDEFRTAIGKWGAFDAQNVDCALEIGDTVVSAAAQRNASVRLKIGNLADFTVLHRL